MDDSPHFNRFLRVGSVLLYLSKCRTVCSYWFLLPPTDFLHLHLENILQFDIG